MPSPKKSKLAKVVLENVRTAIEESGKFYSGKAPRHHVFKENK